MLNHHRAKLGWMEPPSPPDGHPFNHFINWMIKRGTHKQCRFDFLLLCRCTINLYSSSVEISVSSSQSVSVPFLSLSLLLLLLPPSSAAVIFMACQGHGLSQRAPRKPFQRCPAGLYCSYVIVMESPRLSCVCAVSDLWASLAWYLEIWGACVCVCVCPGC